MAAVDDTMKHSHDALRRGWTAPVALVATLAGASNPAHAHDFCIVGATVVTHTSPPAPAVVCVTGAEISAVLEGFVAPADTPQTTLNGGMLVPGFVEISTGIGLIEVDAVEATDDRDGGGDDEVRAAFDVTDAFNPWSALIPVARSGGITSVVATPTGGLIAGRGAWFDLAGDSVAEMRVADGALMFAQLGSAGGDAAGGSRGTAFLRLREVFADAALYASDRAAFDGNEVRPLGASWLDLEALMPVATGAIPLVLRADAAQDLLAGIELGAATGANVAFSGGADAWAIADQLAGRFVIIDPMRNLPEDFASLGARADGAALLDAAGVRVVLTSSESHNARTLRQQAANAVRAGLPWDRAIAAITLHPAQLVGVDDRYGSIAVGQVANLVHWSGDPLEAFSTLETMWIRGVEVSTQTRQDALLERYRTLP